MNTCVCIENISLLGKRESPKVGEVFFYDVDFRTQYPYILYDLSDGSFLWSLTPMTFNKGFVDIQSKREERIEEIFNFN
jgi:hypothetical protein